MRETISSHLACCWDLKRWFCYFYLISFSKISSKIYQGVGSFVTIKFTFACLQRITCIKASNFIQIFKLFKLVLVACVASAISEPLLSFSMLKKSKTKMISTMDNNHLHYLMRIKQEDIKKMILQKLPTFNISKDSKK